MQFAELVIDEIEAVRGSDISTRWGMEVTAGLARFEGNSALLPLFFAWERARGSDALPDANQFQPKSVINAGDGQNVVSIRQDGLCLLRFGLDVAGFAHGIENENERIWLEQDLYRVKSRAVPAYHHIDQTIEGLRRRFSRLMLPIGENDVENVIVAENNDIIPIAASRVS